MKEQWIMTLTSVQFEEEDRTETVLDTEIRYYTAENGDRVIEYEETEATGMEGSKMQLRYAPDGMVSVIRTGEFQTHLVIRQGAKHYCHYATPFGEFAVGVLAKWVRSTLSDEGGRLHFRYTVDANATLLSDNEICADVKKLTMN